PRPSPEPSPARSPMEPNIPEIVAEVTAAFNRYEAALVANDVPALDGFFWNDPRVIRYALFDNGYGFEAIMKSRRARANVDLRRRLMRTVVTTFGRDFATANTEFEASRSDGCRPARGIRMKVPASAPAMAPAVLAP